MKSNILKHSLIFLLLSISNVFQAQEIQRMTITGKVIDYLSRPVEGAEIAGYQQNFNYDSHEDYANEVNYAEKTDANGCFTIDINVLPNLQPVFIIARKEGLALGWDLFIASKRADNKFIVLEKPCNLEGIIVDEKGHAVEGAKVQAVPKSTYLRRLAQSPIIEPKQWLSTKTNSNGKFSFNNFSADVSSDFLIDAPEKSISYKYTPYFMSLWGYETGQENIQLVLPSEIKVHGKVIDAESGDTIEGAILTLRPEDITKCKTPYYPIQIVSDSNGIFSINGVPAGKHYLNAAFSNESQYVDKRVKFEINQDDSVKEVLIEVSKGALAEITILEASTKKPISGIIGDFYESKQDEQSSFYKNAISDKDGIIRIWAPPEECVFRLDYSGYSPSRIDNEHITIIKDQITKREIILDIAQKVHGNVIDENGKPVSDVLVMAHPTGGTDYTDKEGRFEVPLEPEQPFKRLIACDTKHNLAAITEIGDISKPIQITLKPALEMEGKITDPNGNGIPATRLDLIISDSDYLWPLAGEIMTDSQGQYSFKAVPHLSENYEYRISAYSSGYGTLEYKLISIENECEDKLTLKTTVLQPANKSLSGIVFDSNNIPAPEIPIIIHGRGQPDRYALSDNDGKFTLNRICDGPLRIQAGLGNTDIDSGFLTADKIEEYMKIILGQSLVHKKEISLIGKQLPDFNDLNINQFDADLNKKILICFFDMEQRSSRNTVLQLSKKANELKDKDIVVIAVQASTIEQATLDEWIKENSIEFPIGIINNHEQIRFNWGVKALPWLILTTDKEHIVQAEGFPLEQLDEKIEGMNEK